jgi:hypothetical protein
MRNLLAAGALVALTAIAVLLPGDAAVAGKGRSDFAFGKGKWDVSLDTPLGIIPVTVSLQPNGKGKLWLQGGGHLPVVHQSTDTWISWTIELPAVQAPDGNAHTIIGRGTLGEEGDLTGDVVIITAIKDAESPVGYETHVGTFSAARKGK